MIEHKPKFSIVDRDGKKSLWVDDRNIWDLSEKEITNDILNAIINAYFIGACQMYQKMSDVTFVGQHNSKFQKEYLSSYC
jgi:hypothetical protein